MCLMESHTVSMSESNTRESSSKLNIVLEILLVPLPWTYLGFGHKNAELGMLIMKHPIPEKQESEECFCGIS